jgi:hypothetical protein
MDGITLKGSAVSSRSNADSGDETSIEKVENRLLKPPPQFGFDAEMKQLASVISREIYQESPNVRSVLAGCSASLLSLGSSGSKILLGWMRPRDFSLRLCSFH